MLSLSQAHVRPWLLLALSACGAAKMAAPNAPVASADYGPSVGASSYGHGGGDYGHANLPGPEPVPDRPGLGTSWGEQVTAPINYVSFVRASAAPWAEVALHYNDEEGVHAHASYLGTRPGPLEVYAGDGSLSVSLVDEGGRMLPGFQANGRTLVMGEDGERYRIVVKNGTTARFEVVTSVDGLDVIDGKPADPNRRGYIVDPHGSLVIDGFRTSDREVAAFRFGKVAESYAAQTTGDRNVGVIGMAIFAERGAVWTHGELTRRDSADPFPERGYATPPR